MTGEQQPTNVVIADNNPEFRAGLRALLEPAFMVIGEASNGSDAIALVRQTTPNIVLMDINLPESAFEVLREVSNLKSGIRVIMLAAKITKNEIVYVLRLGARGVVAKDSAAWALLKSVRCVMNDELWITREIVSDLVNALRMTPAIQGGERQDYRRPAGAERVAVAIPGSARATSEHAEVSRYKAGAGKFGLTARQVEVVNAIVDGQSNRDIANTYGITECTVKHHLTRIFDKVGVDSRLELAIFAMNHDLNSPLEQPESGHNTSAEHTLVAADRQINSGKPLQDTGSYAYGDVSNTTKNRHR